MTQSRTGALALLEALETQGVTTIFGVPGEETTALMTAIHASQVDFVLCRHEQAAAFMASVHGRLTGTPAACLATIGPGATNLVTGVADAQLDHVPLIALTGQAARGRLKRESHQVIDLEALFAPITKFSRTVVTADDIPSLVAEAVRQANHEKPGAVHLSLSNDSRSQQGAGHRRGLCNDRLCKPQRKVLALGHGSRGRHHRPYTCRTCPRKAVATLVV